MMNATKARELVREYEETTYKKITDTANKWLDGELSNAIEKIAKNGGTKIVTDFYNDAPRDYIVITLRRHGFKAFINENKLVVTW